MEWEDEGSSLVSQEIFICANNFIQFQNVSAKTHKTVCYVFGRNRNRKSKKKRNRKSMNVNITSDG